MTIEANEIAKEIMSWNMKSARDLRDMLNDLRNCRDENGDRIDTQAFIDMSDLPTARIPDDIATDYPVWAVDLDGNALVGDDAGDIESLESIRAAMVA